jgi:transcriptional regulator with XRE-family HTH domain
MFDYYTASDKAILEEIGKRLHALRLRRNVTQEELAERTTLSPTTIKSMEKGSGKLVNLIAVLRELNALQELDNFIPEAKLSPVRLAATKARQRQRATGSSKDKKS